jgi:DNA-binding transcriptional MerR regulator
VVRAIKRAQALGFTLKEIAELNNLRGRGRSVERVAEAARTKLADIDAKIAALTSMRERLRQVLHACKCNGDVGRCEILAGLGD